MSAGEQPLRPARIRIVRLTVITFLVIVVVYIGVHGALRGWELQRRLVCAHNLQELGRAARVYASAGVDETPLIEWLARTGVIKPWQTTCPSSRHPNYILVPHRSGMDDQAIVAYEPKSNHGGDGGNVLFADGRASFVRMPVYDQMITAIPNTPRSTEGDSPP
jgi:prepilin-type processing-associated H-X9-DG protein